ncbi:MAG: hypothetical protein O2977_00335 [Cyanobacteria bacterium]|nr:hypothetical protein [Cyanobacteriota bacterium]MDA0886099.1 hypothetical protein [Cyanobacteriota bacterium]MDA1204764.1 hypothetical protein [Cyanobacteriota bacterium]
MTKLEAAMGGLGHWLLQLDGGFEILLLVGLSMSLAHLFALVANQLTPRQIVFQLLLDALVLAVALLLATLVDIVLLALVVDGPLQPWALFESLGAALLPGVFYMLVAAPYVSNLIAVTIWVLIHLNVVAVLQVRFALPAAQALALATPGYCLALLLVSALFYQGWQRGYRRLADSLGR